MAKPSLLLTVTQLLESPQGVSAHRLAHNLDISPASTYRLLAQLRGTFGKALVKDAKTHRYRIDGDKGLEWPGIFMQSNELPLVLAMLDWLQNTGEAHFQKLSENLRTKIEAWIHNTDGDLSKWNEIIRILPSHSRRHLPSLLPELCKALFLRRKISVDYRPLRESTSSERAPKNPGIPPRILSPQTLVYYRDTWYLDAFCHLRNGLRTFSLHRLRGVAMLNEAAKRVPKMELKNYFADSYGIFGGKADKQAEIVFQGKAADYISHEVWHPKQTTTPIQDGKVKLSLPYSDERELIRDLMRWCDNIVEINPPALKHAYVKRLSIGLALLAGSPHSS